MSSRGDNLERLAASEEPVAQKVESQAAKKRRKKNAKKRAKTNTTEDAANCAIGIANSSFERDFRNTQTASKHETNPDKTSSQKHTKLTSEMKKARDMEDCTPDGSGPFALTMHQPWASLLVHGIKRIEGRSWSTKYRGRIWIHAAGRKASPETIKILSDFQSNLQTHYDIRDLVQEQEAYYTAIWRMEGKTPTFPKYYPCAALIGCIDIVDCLKAEQIEAWTDLPYSVKEEVGSPHGFLCENPRTLVIPQTMRGSQMIWNLPGKVANQFESALRAAQVGWQPWKWSNFKMPDNLKDIKLSSSKNRNKWQEKYGDACKDRRLDSWSTRSDSPSNAISPKAQKRSEHSFPSRLQQRSDNKESTTWQNSSLQFSKPQNITTALEDDFATIDPPESIWTKRLAQQQKDVVAKISQSEPQSISPSLRVEKTAAEQDKPQIRISPPVEQNQIHPAAPSLGVGAFLASRDEFQNASQASFQPYSAPVRLYSNPQIPDSDPQIPDSNPQIPDSDPQIPVEATSAYIQEAKIDVQASSQKTPQSARKDPYNQHNEENVLQISESSVENLTQRKVGSQKKQPSSTWIQDKNRTQRWREYDASVSAKDRQIKNPNFSSAMNSRLVDPVPSNTARGLDTSSNLLIMTQQRDQTSQNLPGSFDMFAMQRPVLAEGAGKLENREVALIPEDECASHTEDFFHKMPTPEDFFHKMPTPVTVPKTSSDKHLDALHSFSESQGVLLPTKSIGEHIVDLKQADYSNWSIEDSEGLPSTENLAQSFANVPSEYRRVAPRSLATFQPYRPESGESNTGESVSDANALDYLLRPHAHSPAVAESDSKSTENGKVLIPSIQRNLRAIDTQTDDHSAASMGLSKVPRQHDIEDSHPNQTVVDFNSKFVPLEPLANYHLANSFTTLQRSTGTERLLSNIHSHLDFPHPALLGVQNGGFIQPASQQEIHSVSGLSDPRFEVKSSVNMQDQCQRQNTAIQFSQRRPNGTAASFSEFSQQPSKKSELPKVPPGFTGVWQG